MRQSLQGVGENNRPGMDDTWCGPRGGYALVCVPLVELKQTDNAPRLPNCQSSSMTTYQIVYWRDIPAQVKVGTGRKRAARQMSLRFQEAIDRAAMRSGLLILDDYLAEWRRARLRSARVTRRTWPRRWQRRSRPPMTHSGWKRWPCGGKAA